MGALNPLFLAAAVAVGVPLFLHLFQRHRSRRLSFPAIRYLERTEREHARRIRFRQLLLLFLRVAILLLVVLAGARLFLRGRGAAHPPTALAVVLDNSMSSGRVVGARRVLDELKERARTSVAEAGPDDRIWILRAGEPWSTVAPLSPARAMARVDETEVSAARGDLSATLARAAGLVSSAGLEAREIHLLSDLQATAFPGEEVAVPPGIPVVVWRPETPPEPNRALARVLVGGGLAPLVGQRTQVTVAALPGPDSAELAVRLVMGGRVRGATTVPAGSQASIPVPAVSEGWVTGWVESDPDALRADDRRAFAFRARPAPRVAVGGEPGPFLDEALGVLLEADRVIRAGAGAASDLLVSAEGEALAAAGDGGALVVPPADPALLPALNRRLAAAGIPWRYGRGSEGGAAPLAGTDLPEPLDGVEVRRWYRMELAGAPPAPPRTLARVAGDPWAVEGTTASGLRYLLLASPLDDAASTLPVSAEMVRFVDWAAGSWAAVGGGPVERTAGESLAAPREARSVVRPDGRRVPVDRTRSVRETDQVGLYTFLDADSAVVSVAAVNPPPPESELAPLSRGELDGLLGGGPVVVDRPERWAGAVFRTRQGPELWLPLLAAAGLLLLVESLVASAGLRTSHRARPSPTPSRTRGAV